MSWIVTTVGTGDPVTVLASGAEVALVTAEAQEVTLPIPSAECAPLTNLLTPEHSSPDACGRHAVALEPYGYRWFRVGPLLDVITREAR